MMSVPRVTDVRNTRCTVPYVQQHPTPGARKGLARRENRFVEPFLHLSFLSDAERHKAMKSLSPAILLFITLSLLRGIPQALSTLHVAKITCIRFNRLDRLGLG